MTPLMIVAAAGSQAPGRIRELVQAAQKIGKRACHGSAAPAPGATLVLAGENSRELAGQMAAETGQGLDLESGLESGLNILALVLPQGSSWDLLKTALIDLARQINPGMILFSQTTMAREVGPALAVALGGVSIANASALEMDGEAFIFTRPVLDNTRVQEVRVPKDELMVVSLAAGAVVEGRAASDFPVGKKESSSGGTKVSEREISTPGPKMIRRLSLSARRGAGEGRLGQAPVVVAAGRGIGEKENLDRVAEFTAVFPGAVMAASRPLVDQGWVGYDRQVGITGAVVSPDLYIALGISGSSQHLAGMAGSKWVVSVNNSPEAPICRHSDLCIQADALNFIEAFLAAELEDKDKK